MVKRGLGPRDGGSTHLITTQQRLVTHGDRAQEKRNGYQSHQLIGTSRVNPYHLRTHGMWWEESKEPRKGGRGEEAEKP